MNNHISQPLIVFHERVAPERGELAGYAALMQQYDLQVPVPERISLISTKHKRYETDEWMVFTPRHAPSDNLHGQLTFALKYEGVDLAILKTLFETIPQKQFEELVRNEPTGQYSRKIWFLYEWLLDEQLDLPDAKTGNFTELIDTKLQYTGPAENSSRHRVRNNLPGTRDFCPLIRRTKKLDDYQALHLSEKIKSTLFSVHKDILTRASSFLLLKDSKASYAIEGEAPSHTRALRWGNAIGQAGQQTLTEEELLRLQQIVIQDSRFIKMGWRQEGGFIGEHDRITRAPIPDHISAKPEDLPTLLRGLQAMNERLRNSDYDPVLIAAAMAFGFVFIHPFVDGNGRLHRYLIHHILAQQGFTPKNMVFPVSFAILNRLDEYREVLESYSKPRLNYIRWKQTEDYNVEVLNDTLDLYRYFDATRQAEFLYRCIQITVDEIIPEEVDYLQKYDAFTSYIEHHFEMPSKWIDLLYRFLEQGNGKLSKRARNKEFGKLTDAEVRSIEAAFEEINEES